MLRHKHNFSTLNFIFAHTPAFSVQKQPGDRSKRQKRASTTNTLQYNTLQKEGKFSTLNFIFSGFLEILDKFFDVLLDTINISKQLVNPPPENFPVHLGKTRQEPFQFAADSALVAVQLHQIVNP